MKILLQLAMLTAVLSPTPAMAQIDTFSFDIIIGNTYAIAGEDTEVLDLAQIAAAFAQLIIDDSTKAADATLVVRTGIQPAA